MEGEAEQELLDGGVDVVLILKPVKREKLLSPEEIDSEV